VNCTAITPALLDALPPPDEDLPLAVFPSAGLPVECDGRLDYPISPERFGREGVALARRGVRLIGGCCGAGPAHVRALVRSLEEAGIISSS
jgi:methionine synthase I (cobalamin-dependent)